MKDLTAEKPHLVFVYGTLMQGYHNHMLLEDAIFLGQAQTAEKYRLTYTSFPMMTEVSEVKVKGELYRIDEREFDNLDILEGYPQLYYRKEIPILHREKTYSAWTYFYTRGEGRYEIPSGNYHDVRLNKFYSP